MTLHGNARQILDQSISEREWLRDVIQLAHINGWLVTHFRTALAPDGHWLTAISGDKGFPDLVLVRGRRLIFAELKTERGRVMPEQQRWLDALRHANLEVGVYVWRPSDRETVAHILAGRVI
jgi:hypothetical protein